MVEWVSSGAIVDLVLILVAIETAALYVWLTRKGEDLRFWGILPTILAGTCLLLALRAALSGAAWPWSAIWIAASLPLHLLDLKSRLGPPSAHAKKGDGSGGQG